MPVVKVLSQDNPIPAPQPERPRPRYENRVIGRTPGPPPPAEWVREFAANPWPHDLPRYFAVVAGNAREFVAFAEGTIADLPPNIRYKFYQGRGELRVGNDLYFYVDDPRSLRGVHGWTPIWYGTWTNRQDAMEIERLAEYEREIGYAR